MPGTLCLQNALHHHSKTACPCRGPSFQNQGLASHILLERQVGPLRVPPSLAVERAVVWSCESLGRMGGKEAPHRRHSTSPPRAKLLIYSGWSNLSVAVILTTSVPRSQSEARLAEVFTDAHKSSKMKTQRPLKYTPRLCAVQLEAFMTPVRAFMTL